MHIILQVKRGFCLLLGACKALHLQSADHGCYAKLLLSARTLFRQVVTE